MSDSQKYKAELYDEVWHKATDMGYMNVTMALEAVATLRAELSGCRAANMVLRDELKTERLRADTAVADANDAERQLAALREELHQMGLASRDLRIAVPELEKRLTDAEQRNAELVELLRATRELVRPSAVLSPSGEFAHLKTRMDTALLPYPAPIQPARILGCADAAWLLYDGGFYGQHGVLVMPSSTILQKATSYAGYIPTESGASE